MILHLINMFAEAHRKRQQRRKVHKQAHLHDAKRFKVWGIRSNKRTHDGLNQG